MVRLNVAIYISLYTELWLNYFIFWFVRAAGKTGGGCTSSRFQMFQNVKLGNFYPRY